jgi:serine/threonine protein kinase/formylglycine-generating enzyme required for sulfatase activity
MSPGGELELALAELFEQDAGEGIATDALLARHAAVREALGRHLTTLAEIDQMIEAEVLGAAEPRRLDQYVLLHRIGRGGMGTVYLAEHERERRLVAIKLIERSLTQAPAMLQRFEREAQLAAKLRHPNLVAVFEQGAFESYAYYAMEFVPGISLAKAITAVKEQRRQGQRYVDLAEIVRAESSRLERVLHLDLQHPTSTGEAQESYFAAAARITAELADAIAYLHEQDIVHRDVKPENVLLDHSLTPLLSDFGLAKNWARVKLTRTGAPVGTPQYMSPEMATGGAQGVDHRTDIYSLGVTFYELLTLQAPFAATSPHELLHKIAVEVPPRPRRLAPDVPRDLETIVLKAIEKNPDRRYQSARELAEDLRRFLRFDRIHARPPGPVRQAARLLQRYRVPSLVVGLALASLASWWFVAQEVRASERRGVVAQARELLAQGRFHEARSLLLRAQSAGAGAEIEPLLREANGIFPVPISSRPEGAEVTAYRLTEIGPEPGPGQKLGTTRRAPDTLRAALAVGQYLLLVEKPDHGYGEYRLTVTWQREQSGVAVELRPTAAVTGDMVLVPAGTYWIGHDPKNARGTPFDLEERQVDVAAYFIDRCEVSNQQYAAFVEATGAQAPWVGGTVPSGSERLPVVGINWEEASAYAEWAGKRLPTQIEWEIAARGPDRRLYTWGNEFDPEKANLGLQAASRQPGTAPELRPPRPLAVVAVDAATQDVSPCGALHMIGNVREWVFDVWSPRPGVQPHEHWQLPSGHRVLRGSSWFMVRSEAASRASHRMSMAPQESHRDVGFRCAKSKRP